VGDPGVYVAADGRATLSKRLAERFPNSRRTQAAAPLHRNYTNSLAETLQQSLQTWEKEVREKGLRPLEAGSGIEPLYEDLQSSA
jgi:hypothetical protein